MSKLNPLPGQEGYERIYNAGGANGSWKKQNNTCCEICRNGGGGCLWTDAGEPVEGWIAEPSSVRIDMGKKMTSYMIVWCPEFEEGDIISENVQARLEGKPAPNELDGEGLLKLAEKVVSGIAKDYVDALKEADKARKSFLRNKNRWNDYKNALTALKPFDEVLPKGVIDALQKRNNLERDIEAEKKLSEVLTEVEKKLREKEEKKKLENEKLAVERVARMETAKALRAEQKRIDKLLMPEIIRIEEDMENAKYDCRL